MSKIKVCLDHVSYTSKEHIDPKQVAGRIAKKGRVRHLSDDTFIKFASDVGLKGHTFCPATFTNGTKDKQNFEQMQIFPLDFDGKTKQISFDEVKKRAEKYELPIKFAYETFSSTAEKEKFRIVLLHESPVEDIRAAEIIHNALQTIFPEADKSCSVAHMYYGNHVDDNNGLLHYDKSTEAFNIESLTRNMTHYLKDTHGDNNYKHKIKDFAKKNKITLDHRDLLDIVRVEVPSDSSKMSVGISNTEVFSGVSQNEKKLPDPFIENNKLVIKGFGNKFSNYQYRINLEDGSTNSYVSNNISNQQDSNRRTPYRSDVLDEINKVCRLYREFENGNKPDHNELFAIATNVYHIESGSDKFMELLLSNGYYNQNKQKYDKWDKDLKYIRRKNMKPQSCNTFCPYHNTCTHGTNILSTIKPTFPIRIAGYVENFAPVDKVEKELDKQLDNALKSTEPGLTAIIAQTSLGKSRAFIKRMSGDRRGHVSNLLIAAPTNGLKRELHDRAASEGIKDIIVSPSLHELGLPDEIQSKIDKRFNTGRHKSVTPYLKNLIKKGEDDCVDDLLKYIDERKMFYDSDCNAITTHKNFILMDVVNLIKYNAAITDEDIILKSIIPNQCVVPLAKLEKVLENDISNGKIAKKMNEALKRAEKESFFELELIEVSVDELAGMKTAIDIPAFCSATKFYSTKARSENAGENDLHENKNSNSLIFYRPVDLQPKIPTIMVSATMNEDILRHLYGDIVFHQCRTAPYIGTLNQYPTYSMSRSFIDKYPGIFNSIQAFTGIDKIITFMKYGKGELYYGNTDGRDIFKGKDLNVIGTPHQPEWMYKLFAYTFDFDFDINARLIPNMLVEHNGWRFPFTTYEDPVLRNIQFYMIESELEQAVGRARLLRCPCIVNLFSNFPLRQAVMMECNLMLK